MNNKYISRYFFPFEDVYYDLSKVSWQKYDEYGVVMASKERLIKQYKISRDILYSNKKSYYYHPVLIAQCALGCYNLLADGHQKPYEKIFWSNIKWLLNNGVSYKNTLVYPFPFGLPDFHSKPFWVSGMYQGQILSALVRAYKLTNDLEILSACEKIWNSFYLRLGDKYGFRYETKTELWFEEAPQFPPKHILNGFIYSLWGIYDYMKLNGDSNIKFQWDKSIHTLEKYLPNYDTGFWSKYDLTGNIASYYYHGKVHTLQLKILYSLTKKEIFNTYYKKWETYKLSFKSKLLKKIFSTYHILIRKRSRYNKRVKNENYVNKY